MKFKAVYALLISSFILMLSVYILTSNTLYVQLVHLLLPSSIAAQSQPTLPSQSTSSLSSSSSSSSSSVSSLPDVFQKVENSVVQITSTKSNPNEVIILNGVPQTGRSTALGSGFVYDNQGHIVTNYHVVSGVKKADVTFTDGNTYSANVVGKDPNSDVVILQITSNFSEEKVVPLPLANSSAVR
ncbi:MAG: S1C family serine protease, partial [Nitrososphaeraceae archaeon]